MSRWFRGVVPSLSDEEWSLINPSPDQIAAQDAISSRLLEALEQACPDQRVSMQGSQAKGTWLPDSNDLDVFVGFPPGTPESEMEAVVDAAAQKVLTNPRAKYAQHPYRQGEFEGVAVDLVPHFIIASAEDLGSAVDRTPFHTSFVRANFTDGQLQDTRLLKRFAKSAGVYGAETWIGGFSGYLIEVLVHHFGSAVAVIAALAEGLEAIPPGFQVDEMPLQIQDPVDPTRNVAAGVRADTLARAQRAAQFVRATQSWTPFLAPFEDKPTEGWQDWPNPWCRWRVTLQHDQPELVIPSVLRTSTMLATELSRLGWPPVRTHHLAVGAVVDVIFCSDEPHTPPAVERNVGPRADREPNASKFLAKWSNHPDLLRPPFEEDGCLVVELRQRAPDLASALARVSGTGNLPKHVQRAKREIHSPDQVDALLASQWQHLQGRDLWESL